MKINFSSIKMMKWAKFLFPINRSITGQGVRQTIKFIKNNINSKFKNLKIKSNTKVYDWKIPNEWNISEAYIDEINGERICDIKNSNLHVLGYSKNINKIISFHELKKNIYYIKNKPNTVPYLTSYYKKKWGFCLSYNNYKKMKKNKKYKVVINSKHSKGNLDYCELLIKGKSKKEILVMSYICHPSMANNELSGPLIIMALSKILKSSNYSVRLLLVPETIGAIAYIQKNYSRLKKNLLAGLNLSCVGDNGPFTLISSKEQNTYADKIARRVLIKTKKLKVLSFLKRGSNERQFGCQNLKFPFVTICRTRFGDFKEYHTSDDNLGIISEANLRKTLKQILLIIKEIQKNKVFEKTMKCEPFFSKYNLARTTRGKYNSIETDLYNLSAYVDKNYDEYELTKILGRPKRYVKQNLKVLIKNKIIKEFI
jgi:aminopeptidase-like protein